MHQCTKYPNHGLVKENTVWCLCVQFFWDVGIWPFTVCVAESQAQWPEDRNCSRGNWHPGERDSHACTAEQYEHHAGEDRSFRCDASNVLLFRRGAGLLKLGSPCTTTTMAQGPKPQRQTSSIGHDTGFDIRVPAWSASQLSRQTWTGTT